MTRTTGKPTPLAWYAYLIPAAMVDDKPAWTALWRRVVAEAGYEPVGDPEVAKLEPATITIDGVRHQIEPDAVAEFVARGSVRPAGTDPP